MNFAESVRSENRQPSNLLATRGGLDVRLAMTAQEIAACQKLRYKVFHEELNAKTDAVAVAAGMDSDGFDEICDHLLVSDGGEVVGGHEFDDFDHVLLFLAVGAEQDLFVGGTVEVAGAEAVP